MSVTTLQAAPLPAPVPQSNPMMPSTFEGAMKLAEMMSRGKLVPSHLQNQPSDCLMVIEQAMRFGMSPFAVAQATSVISGKLMLEGKLVAAAVHTSGVLAGRLSYDFTGDGQGRTVRVSGTLRGEQQPREVSVSVAEAATANQLWKKQPDQQLVYHGTRVWARRFVPEVMLGVYSPEEMEVTPPIHREPQHHAAGTIDHAVMQPAEPVGTSFGNRVDRIIFTVIPKATTLPLLEKARAKSDPLLEELDQAGRHDLRDRLIEAFDAARDSLPFDPTVSEQQPDPLSGILAHLATLETGAAIDQWQRTDAMKAAVRAFNKADNDRLGEAVNARRRELAEREKAA